MAKQQVALAFPVAAAHHPEIIQGIVEFAKQHGSWTFLTAPETYDLSVLSLYVCEARVERARQMLMQVDGPTLDEIAAACGFNNARSFRLVFHRLTGTTPSQYRRARRATDPG